MYQFNLSKISLLLSLLTVISFSACQKDSPQSELEVLLQQYPAEVTMDNWEEFVYAPQEVLDYHERKVKGVQQPVPLQDDQTNANARTSCNYEGWVKAWSNGNYIQMARTQVEARQVSNGSLIFAKTTNTATPYNLCKSAPTISAKFRWYFKRKNATYPRYEWVAGVSSFDLVRIQKHLLAIDPFTHLWQYLAADVDRNGLINSDDIDLLGDLILGQRQNLPGGNLGCTGRNQPFQYMEASDYVNLNNEPNNGSNYLTLIYATNCPEIYPDPISGKLVNINAYAFKRGDVNGDWTP